MEATVETEYEQQNQTLNFNTVFSHAAKLKELLRNITSTELHLCSHASKQFIKLLKSDAAPDILSEYLQTSSKCVELSQAWDLRKFKPGFPDILKLISTMLDHPFGKHGGVISRALDDFARGIVQGRMDDLYKELNSKEGRRQKAALLLLAVIVRRRLGLAWEVLKIFDFKIASFGKLADWKGRRVEGKRKHLSTRKAFVKFAMSFLEIGNPRLLREILQQRAMYSGVLRGLGDDDDDIAVHVLTTLRDKVLVPESLVPPGLRSVLFGIVTLEQLVTLSGKQDNRMAAEVAHNVLLMVCTDPSNGLMPALDRQPNPLRGNPRRLVDVMKKLKATEIEHHKDLLLAIVKGRPSFGSTYLNEFPYYIDDLKRHNWFASVSLAAKVISAVADGLTFSFNSSTQEPPGIDSADVQNIIHCIGPRTFTRDIIHKGLKHADPLVKHATLKFISEALKLLDSLFGALKEVSSSSSNRMGNWASLMKDIEHELQMSLPLPGELFSLLSPLYNCPKSGKKRPADADTALEHGEKARKKLKTSIVNEDLDIVIGGISSTPDNTLPEDSEQSHSDHNMDEADDVADVVKLIGEIWEVDGDFLRNVVHRDEDAFFYSKVLDAFKIYRNTIPYLIEGSYDFFKVLPEDVLLFPAVLQRSLLSLLVDVVGWSSPGKTSTRTPAEMFKHLHKFIELLIYSPIKDIKDKAYILAREVMLSTGAFDRNPQEVSAWFSFIPGYSREINVEAQGVQAIQEFSSVIVSFLRNAVSIIGKRLFDYFKRLRCYIEAQGARDQCPDFGPFFLCVLDECTKLLSKSRKKSCEKTMISVYVCSTLKYLLETQGEAKLLPSLIDYYLSEIVKFDVSGDSGDLCERRPVKTLLLFSRNILHHKGLAFSSNVQTEVSSSGSFADTLDEIKKAIQSEHGDGLVKVSMELSRSILCTEPQEICHSFPLLINISAKLSGVPFSILSSIFFFEQNLISSVSKLWPKMFVPGVKMFIAENQGEVRNKDTVHCMDINPIQSASAAFSFFLKGEPFHVLFPSVLLINSSQLTLNLLTHKIPLTTPDEVVSSLSHVLFWLNKAKESYRIKPQDRVEVFSENCITLAEHMLNKVLVEKLGSDSSADLWVLFPSQYVPQLAKVILCHPAVAATLERPLPGNEGFEGSIFEENLENFLELATQRVQKIDLCVLNLLSTTCELLTSFFHSRWSLSGIGCAITEIAKVFRGLHRGLLLKLRDMFNRCIKTEDFAPLVPISFAAHKLLRFISPFELLETVHLLISEIDFTEETSSLSLSLHASLHIATHAFDLLSAYLREPLSEKPLFSLFWEVEKKSIDVFMFEKVFFQVCEIASHFEIDAAYIFLQKALKVVKAHHDLENCILPVMHVSRVVASTPVKLLSHCMLKVTKAKSCLLFSLTDLSSLHLSIFGHLFSSMINKSSLVNAGFMHEECSDHLSNEELVLLLPTAWLYLNSSVARYGRLQSENVNYIPSLYWKILHHGFSEWNTYVSEHIFEIEPSEPWPSSLEQFLDVVSTSLLGKSVRMVHLYLDASVDAVKMETRMNLFKSLYLEPNLNQSASSGDVFDFLHLQPDKASPPDCKSSQFGILSLGQSLNIVNKAAAKIYISRILLFPEHVSCESPALEDQVMISEGCSNTIDLLRIQFLNILVQSWELILENFPSTFDDPSETEGKKYSIFKYLEQFIGQNILDLTTMMNDCLTRLPSLTFVNKLAKSSLLYRFKDTCTLKMLRTVLTMLCKGNFSCISVLQQLLGHSQFVQTLPSAKNSESTSLGMIFTPMHSIVRSLNIPQAPYNSFNRESKLNELEQMRQLEVIKLLRVLLRVSTEKREIYSQEGNDINLRQLVCLLLSSYGATMGEIDLEIFHVINEIESINQSTSGFLVELDYLWGLAASNVRKEEDQKPSVISGGLNSTEASKERRKIKFRENFPIDPRMCAATVVNFMYVREIGDASPGRFEKSNYEDEVQGNCTQNVRMSIYDPAFILRFSVHCLSEGYVEPQEFTSSGLLAITFASLSSPDDELRKLGYQALGRFKNDVERSRKGSDIMRLRLLLLYLQNGIEQLGQRISSATSVFAAESTLILLNKSHDYHSTVIKFLMHHPKANMEAVPLFESSFGTAANSIADMAWMLRLLYAGLNTDDDASIYVKNSIFESILSYHASSLSDDNLKDLILQVLKKSVKLPKMARHLVVNCGLIPWLSSYISSEEKGCSQLARLAVGMEVLNDITSCRKTFKWLQNSALWQIAELSTHIFKFLVVRTDLMKEQSLLVRRCLHVLESVLKTSQIRKAYKPCFSLSAEGLVRLCEAVDSCMSGACSSTAEFGLKIVLMSTPPNDIFHTDPEKLLKFVSWAISIALRARSRKEIKSGESSYQSTVFIDEKYSDDALVIKLVRWLTASVILSSLSWRSQSVNSSSFLERSNSLSVQILLEWLDSGPASNMTEFGNESLAASIIHMQQLIGINCQLLPSVVSALCLLLLKDSSRSGGETFSCQVDTPASLCSKIRCPAEANPAWRWSFYQPWSDSSSQLTQDEKVEEIRACQILLVEFTNMLVRRSSSYSRFLPIEDVEKYMAI